MPEEVLFKSETKESLPDIANYLRKVADKLESGEDLTFDSGNESVVVSPSQNSVFEIKIERETSSRGRDEEMSVEFEIEWKTGEDGGDSLSIE